MKKAALVWIKVADNKLISKMNVYQICQRKQNKKGNILYVSNNRMARVNDYTNKTRRGENYGDTRLSNLLFYIT